MSKCVSFQNKGVIDPRAYRLFGASAKQGSNPIGFFGTGLKYAIAIFLRLGCRVELYHGRDRVIFKKREVVMRDNSFSVVTAEHDPIIDAETTEEDRARAGLVEELGFTTDLGKTWQAWQALRELWCNALDEDGEMQAIQLDPREGYTTIVVTGQAVMDAYYEREKIMLTSTPRLQSEGVEIHERRGTNGYLRGIRVLELGKPSVLTYNVVGRALELTEDRTVKHSFYFAWYVRDAILNCTDEHIIQTFLAAPEGTYEHQLDVSDGEPGECFMRMLEERVGFKLGLNPSVRRLFFKKRGHEQEPEIIETTETQREMLERAKLFCRDIGLPVDQYEILVTDTRETDLLGFTNLHTNRVYINKTAFNKGTKQVAGTLMEELVHQTTRLGDETRALQNFLVDLVVTQWENRVGRAL